MESSEMSSARELDTAVPVRRRFTFRNAADRLARCFPENTRSDAVTTSRRIELPPDRLWQELRFYEEIPLPPPAVLRLVLPMPLHSKGPKLQLGALIRCVYEGGHLVKRTTVSDPPRLLRFEVLEQQIGIENCITMGEGSYEIRPAGTGSEVLLTTCYRGHLRPRFLWRPLERALAHAVHRHILDGMRLAVI